MAKGQERDKVVPIHLLHRQSYFQGHTSSTYKLMKFSVARREVMRPGSHGAHNIGAGPSMLKHCPFE